jgi:hypothetical protein
MTTFTRIPEEENPSISVDVSRRLSKIGMPKMPRREEVTHSSNRSKHLWRFHGVSLKARDADLVAAVCFPSIFRCFFQYSTIELAP